MKARGKPYEKLPFGAHLYDAAVMAFIDAYWKRNYSAPSIRDIMAGAGVPSGSHVTIILGRLVAERGYQFAEDGRARSIVPPWVMQAIDAAVVDPRAIGQRGGTR